MSLDEKKLTELLAPRPVKYFPQVESTQDIAIAWLNEGVEAGAVVITDEQTAGRGRHGRTWHTPPSVAIAMSVVLRPPVDALPRVTMLGALAITELLKGMGAEDISIKWPNDVRLMGRKVCGVLPEAIWEGDQLRGVALGMGINVRNDFTGTEFENTAISIEPALNRHVERTGMIKILLDRIDYWMDHLETESLFEAWKTCLSTLGQPVTVANDAGMISGIAEGVDADGALLVRDGTGQLQRVMAGDVALGGD